MKRTFRIFWPLILGVSEILFSARVHAQEKTTLYNTPQAPNYDFEKWDNPEPWGWNSSSCFEAGLAASSFERNQSVWSSSQVRPGSQGTYSAYIKVTVSKWYYFGAGFSKVSVPMGSLTTGTLYFEDKKLQNAKS